MNKKNLIFSFLVVFILMVQGFLLVTSIFHESIVYDEITYVDAGYGFITKHDFRLDPFNPPFARELVALPLLFNYSVRNDIFLFWPRIVVVCFSLLLSCLIFIFAKKLYGVKAGFIALIFAAFEPTLLTHGHYATMDTIFAFFFLLSIYLFWLWKNNWTVKKIIVFGMVIGLTLSIKISALPFLGLSLPLLFLYSKKKWSKIFTFRYLVQQKRSVTIFLIVTLLSLWSTYFFTWEPPLGYRFDTKRKAIALAGQNPLVKMALTVPIPLGSYVSTIKQIILYNYSTLYARDSFSHGEFSILGLPGYYFIPALLIKTPVPLLLCFFLSLWLFRNKQNKFILVPIIVLLICVVFTRVTLVTRYILPIYPLLIIFASQIITLNTFKKYKWSNGVIFVLICWFVVTSLKVSPHPITYFNELVGGRQNGYKYLVDSNLDWGQGVPSLVEYQRQHKNYKMQLAYFGYYPPSMYGLTYERIRDKSLHESKKVEGLDLNRKKTLVVISATCWVFCQYYKDPAFYNRQPEIVAGTFLVFKND